MYKLVFSEDAKKDLKKLQIKAPHTEVQFIPDE